MAEAPTKHAERDRERSVPRAYPWRCHRQLRRFDPPGDRSRCVGGVAAWADSSEARLEEEPRRAQDGTLGAEIEECPS